MSNPTCPAPRDHRENARDAAPTAMALTPLYRWLIVLNPVLSAVGLVLGLAATARGH